MMEKSELIDLILDCVKEVRNVFSAGYVEEVYKKALAIELKMRGLNCQVEYPIPVSYKGIHVGDYYADIVVENRIILELKAVQNLINVHELQLVNYLTATGIDDGLLINFGSDKIQIRHKYRVYTPQKMRPSFNQ